MAMPFIHFETVFPSCSINNYLVRLLLRKNPAHKHRITISGWVE